MTELIDVSKWFDTPTIVCPDMVAGVFVVKDTLLPHGFQVLFIGGGKFGSKSYPDMRSSELAMSEFCKKIQGDI